MRATTLLRKCLSIQHLIVGDFEFDDRGIVISVTPANRIPRCGECGSNARSVYDRRQRYWRHHDMAGMMTRVRYSIRRVRCPKCASVKTEQVPWADSGCNFTYAFEERVSFLAQQCSKTAVTKLMRIAWRTVSEIVIRTVSEYLDKGDDRIDGLRHIGADEISYRRHHKYVTTVVDHELGVVVWAKEGKNAATLRAFFEELGPERCKLIETVTIDMSKAFISVVKEMVPHAKMIFDRFHVQRILQDALDKTRRDEVRDATTKEQKTALKNTRNAIQKRECNRTPDDLETLEELRANNSHIFDAILLKDSFAAVLDKRQVNVARHNLEQWAINAEASGLVHFQRAAKTIRKHVDGILEYVRTRFSNGRTEGLNGKIRTITRRSFGFHSAAALISMIFLCCGGVEVTPAFSSPSGFH